MDSLSCKFCNIKEELCKCFMVHRVAGWTLVSVASVLIITLIALSAYVAFSPGSIPASAEEIKNINEMMKE